MQMSTPANKRWPTETQHVMHFECGDDLVVVNYRYILFAHAKTASIHRIQKVLFYVIFFHWLSLNYYEYSQSELVRRANATQRIVSGKGRDEELRKPWTENETDIPPTA